MHFNANSVKREPSIMNN